jgi:Skp family chaperone for outer membrane proteins
MALGGSRAAAQSAPYRPTAAPPPVVVVDVAKIFKEHRRLKARMEELRNDVQTAQASFRKEFEALSKMAETVRGFNPGSPEYKAAEEDYARKRADLDARMSLSEKEFKLRSVKIQYNAYQEIRQEVEYYCQAYGVAVAVNANTEKVDAEKENPNDMMRAMSQEVIYSHKDLDITPIIMKRIAPETAIRPDTRPPGVYVPTTH